MVYSLPTDYARLTSYTSNCVMDNKIMKDNSIKTPAEYRLFLQRNAEKIMEINRNSVVKK